MCRGTRNNNGNNNKEKINFLYKEYELIQKSNNQVRILFAARMLIYMTFCGFVFSNIDDLYQIKIHDFLTSIYFYILIGLYIIGLSVYVTIIEHHISITNYLRKLNKIRKLISEEIGLEKKFLVLPTSDKKPKYGFFGFSEQNNFCKGYPFIIIVINSIIASSIPITLFKTSHCNSFFSLCHSKTEMTLIILVIFVSISIHIIIRESMFAKANENADSD